MNARTCPMKALRSLSIVAGLGLFAGCSDEAPRDPDDVGRDAGVDARTAVDGRSDVDSSAGAAAEGGAEAGSDAPTDDAGRSDGASASDAVSDATSGGEPQRNPLCSPENCTGCCVGGRCSAGTAQHTCGRAGAVCAPCADELSCVGGECKTGPQELCNGRDDDGDGDTDEGCDDDSDGYCDARMTTEGTPETCTLGGGDCDDERDSVNPRGTELCNGLDDDCNDQPDDADVCESQGPLAGRPAHLPGVLGNHSCAADSSTDKIYCFGGQAGGSLWQSNETLEFDPKTNGVRVLSAFLPTGRYGLSCAEDSGTHRIYCFGGYYQESVCTKRENDGCVEVKITPHYLDEIVELDPSTGRLSVKDATLPAGRTDLSCAEDSATHKIYCFGGNDAGPTPTDQILEYDPASDKLTPTGATLPSARYALSCAEDSQAHRLYCFGGHDGDAHLDAIVAYDPKADQVDTLSVTLPKTSAYSSCAESAASHKIYCFAGRGARLLGPMSVPYFVQDITELDPSGPGVTLVAAKFDKGRHSLACVGQPSSDSIFCFGGARSVVIYDDILELRP